MKRTNFFFPQEMLDRLKQAKDKTGLPVSEIIRRAIDDYLKKIKALYGNQGLTLATRR